MPHVRAPVAAVCLLAAAAVASNACATAPHNRYIQRTGSGPIEVLDGPAPWMLEASDMSAQVAGAVREAYSRRDPAKPSDTIEVRNRELRLALQEVAAQPSDPGVHVRAGWAYRKLGVTDRAFDYFDTALRLDDRLAAAYDGRARIWRDWGLAAKALGDATRAVYHAPGSAAAQNTLGTILFALRNCRDARDAFSKAVALAPEATYARDNLALVTAAAAAPAGRCRDASD